MKKKIIQQKKNHTNLYGSYGLTIHIGFFQKNVIFVCDIASNKASNQYQQHLVPTKEEEAPTEWNDTRKRKKKNHNSVEEEEGKKKNHSRAGMEEEEEPQPKRAWRRTMKKKNERDHHEEEEARHEGRRSIAEESHGHTL